MTVPTFDRHCDHIIATASTRAAIAAASILLAMTACSPKVNAPAETPPVVSGDTIQFAANDVSVKTILTAKVEGPREREAIIPGRFVWDEDRTVRVFTPFSGRVEKILVDIGTKVSAGQPLAWLQSPDFATAQTDARKSDATLKVARQSLARAKELNANGIVAAKDLQQAEADFASADAESRRASARLQLYGQRTDGAHADQRFAVVSPIAGVVVERNLNPGQELRVDQPGLPQFVVTDPSRLWVNLDASESDLSNFKVGLLVLISTNQYPDDFFRGEITRVADYIDPVSRTLKLRATVSNADRRLKAEMFVNARIMLPKNNQPTVPENAVYLEGVRSFVFVKAGEGKFVRTGIRVGPTNNGFVPVLSRLKPGEEVVVAGSLLLQQMVSVARVHNDAADQAKTDAPTAPKSPTAPNPATAPADTPKPKS